jgi:hypothetical protein
MADRKRKRQELTPPSDRDGDSTMHSSADEDEMFPDEALPNNPATPMNASAVNANGKRPLSLAQTAPVQGTHTDSETGYSWSRPEDQPGWDWKNTRAREDESRAVDVMVDLGSQIRSKCCVGLMCARICD